MKRALATLLLLAVAIALLLGALYRRSQAETREADRLRVESSKKAAAAIQARDKALSALARIEAESRSCRAEVTAVERVAVAEERAACEALLEAERARGRLDVPPADLDAVVSALRALR